MLKSILTDIPPAPSAASSPSSPLLARDSSSSDEQKKAQTEQQAASEKKLAEFRKFINSSPLQIKIQEIIGQYSVLENYFMTENINKAIQMDSVNRNSLTSSVVDDTFFIIKKCIKLDIFKPFFFLR